MLITSLILLREWTYRKCVKYESVGQRKVFSVFDENLIQYIESKTANVSGTNIDDIVEVSLSATSAHLNFTGDKNEVDPNKLYKTKSAHCVGYASFFAAVSQYLIIKNNLSDTWVVKHRIGKIFFLGINVHNYFNSPFFSDHDFVTIENKNTGEILAIDPTVNDYFYIDYITVR